MNLLDETAPTFGAAVLVAAMVAGPASATVDCAAAAVVCVPEEFARIQDALASDLTGDGTLVSVAEGTYYALDAAGNPDPIDFLGKDARLVARGERAATILDGAGVSLVVRFVADDWEQGGVSRAAVLSGFTIQNGRGPRSGDFAWGGGVQVIYSEPTIENCELRDNRGYRGAGIGVFAPNHAPAIVGNRFEGNVAELAGGALAATVEYDETAEPTRITGNRFLANQALYGGGLWIDGRAVIADSRFEANRARIGGGMNLGESFGGEVVDNLIRGNLATQAEPDSGCEDPYRSGGGGGIGGGPWVSALIARNTIVGNSAPAAGGGGIAFNQSWPRIVNNRIAYNQAARGAGIALYDTDGGDYLAIYHNTITGNTASERVGGILASLSYVNAINNIVYGNQPQAGQLVIENLYLGALAQVTTSIVEGGANDAPCGEPVPWTDIGTEDPRLSPTLKLTRGSTAALDRGSDLTEDPVAPVVDDFEGEPRPAAAGYDIGADERQ